MEIPVPGERASVSKGKYPLGKGKYPTRIVCGRTGGTGGRAWFGTLPDGLVPRSGIAKHPACPHGSAMRHAQALDWTTDGADWPNRHSSRFVKAADLTWHVQTMGQGPVLLLAHGTGASTHSWRDLMPSLARHFTIVAPDLQGHGFTGTPRASGITLHGMAAGLGALLQVLIDPAWVILNHAA
jgi:hypothetical protein